MSVQPTAFLKRVDGPCGGLALCAKDGETLEVWLLFGSFAVAN